MCIFRYYGAGINLGECGITIVNATQNLSGTWSCHMGTARTGAVDAFKEFGVRITGLKKEMAAFMDIWIYSQT